MTEPQGNPTALAELIRSRMAALGRTYRDVAADAGISTAYVHKLAVGTKPVMPNRELADALERGLGLPAETFVSAGMADMRIGEFVLEEGKARAVYELARTVTDEDLDVVLGMLRVMRERPGRSVG